jgi:hypothetical protein
MKNNRSKHSPDEDIAMDAIGEVLTSSITGLVAECWTPADGQWESAAVETPRFGSFLRIDSGEIEKTNVFAVVYDVHTGPQDSVHKPHALRLTRQQLREEQPQIFALLKTEIHAAIIGFERNGIYRPGLPFLCAHRRTDSRHHQRSLRIEKGRL